MTVNFTTPAPEALFPVAGVRLGLAEAGIRKLNRRDLTLLALDAGCTVAGVFTQNRFCAAPVQLCRSHLDSGSEIRALVINTGIANAGTGEAGMLAAQLGWHMLDSGAIYRVAALAALARGNETSSRVDPSWITIPSTASVGTWTVAPWAE